MVQGEGNGPGPGDIDPTNINPVEVDAQTEETQQPEESEAEREIREAAERAMTEEAVAESAEELFQRFVDSKAKSSPFGQEMVNYMAKQEEAMRASQITTGVFRGARMWLGVGEKGSAYKTAKQGYEKTYDRFESWQIQETEQNGRVAEILDLQTEWERASAGGEDITSTEAKRAHKALVRKIKSLGKDQEVTDKWLSEKVKTEFEIKSGIPQRKAEIENVTDIKKVIDTMTAEDVTEITKYVLGLNTEADSEIHKKLGALFSKELRTKSGDALMHPDTKGDEMMLQRWDTLKDVFNFIKGPGAKLTDEQLQEFINGTGGAAILAMTEAGIRQKLTKAELDNLGLEDQEKSADFNAAEALKTLDRYYDSVRGTKEAEIGVKKSFRGFGVKQIFTELLSESKLKCKETVGDLFNSQAEIDYDTKVKEIIDRGQNEIALVWRGTKLAGGLATGAASLAPSLLFTAERAVNWTLRNGLGRVSQRNETLRNWERNWEGRRNRSARRVSGRGVVIKEAASVTWDVVERMTPERIEKFKKIPKAIKDYPEMVAENIVTTYEEYRSLFEKMKARAGRLTSAASIFVGRAPRGQRGGGEA